jgi:hypothetical protein
VLAAALCALLALPVAAQSPGGTGPAGNRDRLRVPERIDPSARFTLRDRDLFRSWHASEYGRGKCPPGLKKKTTVCLPPGRTAKRYTFGSPLPGTVVIAPLPLDLARRLGSPPIGYRYAIVDGDLVKLTVDTMLVVDAINGLTL